MIVLNKTNLNKKNPVQLSMIVGWVEEVNLSYLDMSFKLNLRLLVYILALQFDTI
ncbi:hypothetical protein BDGGKGIB_04356 [Nodularia sphaerocarpa UHCC 0038]|nr:hypothetical protein BDGGKGIB_04356 [Nodularia sphaerocarpa UHCC 0038]